MFARLLDCVFLIRFVAAATGGKNRDSGDKDLHPLVPAANSAGVPRQSSSQALDDRSWVSRAVQPVSHIKRSRNYQGDSRNSSELHVD